MYREDLDRMNSVIKDALGEGCFENLERGFEEDYGPMSTEDYIALIYMSANKALNYERMLMGDSVSVDPFTQPLQGR